MHAIHLVERLQKYRVVDQATNEWESGHWYVAEKTAQQLVGGRIYLHDGQIAPSRFGGEIVSYYVQQGGDLHGCIVFRFRPTAECKGVRTERRGWGNEKKIVWT